MQNPVAIDNVAANARIQDAVNALRSTKTIRKRAQALLERARRGESSWFTVNDGAMATAAALVAQLTRARYPSLIIPYHSRWRHFEAGGVDRAAQLNAALAHSSPLASPLDKAVAQIDLALASVLLDAGAGADWQYEEKHHSGSNQSNHFSRSEGLGVASFHAFMNGLFSSDSQRPLQADAQGLQAITAEKLATAFQVTPSNPLVGLDGRAALLRRLGQALQAQPEIFGKDGEQGRPGNLFKLLTAGANTVQAHDLLSLLLTSLSTIWPAQNDLEGTALGDCWRHSAAQGDGLDDASAGWMPFHKLSQWLTYSLLEPFEWAGIQVEGLDALTGLPEYRNGGLFLDAGVLRLKNPQLARQPHQAGDELIVEWRALTVALLDELAPLVRQQLGLSAGQMPLACVLEGGTWAAGRALAQQLRGGQPPLNIVSDGTVF
jgi:hypothetical protein